MSRNNIDKQVCTASQIYQKLIDTEIKKASGKITIKFMEIETLVKEANGIGALFQEWLGVWLERNNIDVESNTKSCSQRLLLIAP